MQLRKQTAACWHLHQGRNKLMNPWNGGAIYGSRHPKPGTIVAMRREGQKAPTSLVLGDSRGTGAWELVVSQSMILSRSGVEGGAWLAALCWKLWPPMSWPRAGCPWCCCCFCCCCCLESTCMHDEAELLRKQA